MSSFIALYRGPTVASARLIGVSADPQLVAHVADGLLAQAQAVAEAADDACLYELETGRQRALRLVRQELD